ncbi:MAG TPA: hypothetical protein VL728_17285 [Cyclobacteriaceae bacterium]|jgi:hypothetical protein|nr:hypothetical protein [Cyclobacteriaceae bacterium]
MAAQLPDKILVDGNLLDLYTNPLEQYWVRGDKRRPRFVIAPNCQRGYIAHWEIRDSQFLLTAIGGTYEKWNLLGYESTLYTLKTFMPRAKGRPVKALWFSGKLRIPKGRMTMYEHHGYDSRFEQETIISVARGVVTKIVTIDYAHKELFVNTE